MKMIKGYELLLILVPIFIFGAIIYFYGFSGRGIYEGEVYIRNQKFKVDVADTPSERQKGLSGRESLSSGEGLLFTFQRSSVQRFWMKDMLISIDIIWINGDRVIGITENLEPEPGVSVMRLKTYPSPGPVNYVLEVPAGTSERIGIVAGDAVSIRL